MLYNFNCQKLGLLLIGSTLLLTGCLSTDDSEDNSNSSNQISSKIELSSETLNSSTMLSSSFDNSSEFSSSSSLISSMSLSSSVVSSSSGINNGKFTNTSVCAYNSALNTLDCKEKTYKTRVINSQVWMAENLNYGEYISDSASYSTLQSRAQKFCYLNTESNCYTDGGLYQWHTVMGFASSCSKASCSDQISSGNHQGICPFGWHVPKSTEWDGLQTYLGGNSIAGSKMKLKNTGYVLWDTNTYNADTSGFNAFPAGFRSAGSGFVGRATYAFFWEAKEHNSIQNITEANSIFNISDGYYRELNNNSSALISYFDGKMNGFSVRCVKD